MLESAFLQLLKDDVYSLTSKVTNTFHLDLGSHLFFFFLNFIYLFIYLCLRRVFVAACGLSLVAASRGYPLWCVGFSLRWLLLLRSTDSNTRA